MREMQPNTQYPIPDTPNTPRIAKVLAVPATGAGYYEDLAALQAEHVPLPQRFTAPPLTPGFRAVREVAEAVSVGLVLDDGRDLLPLLGLVPGVPDAVATLLRNGVGSIPVQHRQVQLPFGM